MNAKYIKLKGNKYLLTEEGVKYAKEHINTDMRKDIADVFGVHRTVIKKLLDDSGVDRSLEGYDERYVTVSNGHVVLSDEGKKWLTANYKFRSNDELAIAVGVPHRQIVRIACKLGLKKAHVHRQEMNKHNGRISYEKVNARCGSMNRNGLKGKSFEEVYGKEKADMIKKKKAESIRKLIEREKVRASYGMERKSNFNFEVDSVSESESGYRYRLRGRGYILPEFRTNHVRNMNVYYNTDTNRSALIEKRCSSRYGYKFSEVQ